MQHRLWRGKEGVPGVLYHPHFEPSLSWLRTSLLVYDNVLSIVPREAGYTPSEHIQRHLEKLPDTFAPLAPEPVDIVHEYFVLRVLGHAFGRIAAQPKVAALEGIRVRYRPDAESFEDEGLELLGITKLHDVKLAFSVYQMLEESGLIYGRTDDGFFYVNEQAAYLVISFLAQRMSTRIPMRTITDVDTSFLLSAACNVIESGDPVDSRGALASAVLRFHVPEEIGELSHSDYVEIRKRYADLRETFPLYLRDLGELIQVDNMQYGVDLKARIESLLREIDADISRIKRSRIGESIKKWLPVSIGAAVTVGSAFVPDTPSLKYVTGAATVAVQILTEALHKTPIPGRLEGAQSLLLNAKEDILNAHELASSLDMRRILI
jgi:hypothetical protein